MEIKYPIIIIISILLFFLAFFLRRKKQEKDPNKNKVANTSIIKNTPEFKKLIKKYRIFLYLLYVLIFISLLGVSILSSRIIEEQTTEDDIYNRDIILCMDVSGSVLDLNAELVESYKEVVKNLKGERFGISIFNTSSYLLVPLTDDYDYISESLDILSTSIDMSNNYSKYSNDSRYSTRERLYFMEYVYYGTTIGSSTRGSSLAGDGLASCVFDFPNLEEERSRIIVYSTDNDVIGEEYIDVEGAAKIASKKNMTIYTVAPTFTSKKNETILKNISESSGGQYYIHKGEKTVDDIVKGIESKEKSLLKGNKKTSIIDHPTIPFIIMLVSFIILIIIDKVVLS